MDTGSGQRGLALLMAHCRSLDPLAKTARERLDAEVGPTFARELVVALSRDDALHARPVFAA
jgi:hypothetical protein